MGRGQKSATKVDTVPMKPAANSEARENQLIALATNLAEQQLRDGTASAQVITHYLKLGSTKEKLEKDILELQKELVKAKTEALKSAEDVKELYTQALEAFKAYGGTNEL